MGVWVGAPKCLVVRSPCFPVLAAFSPSGACWDGACLVHFVPFVGPLFRFSVAIFSWIFTPASLFELFSFPIEVDWTRVDMLRV